ncbi:hypothetical protein CKAH01_15298 [Colletotrichum kahawae]|uniref:Uncharacterized protein n=1 Tax=Colletotrichum kahawae TaxID=34407 RepID=A0AAD9YGK2_COLKA|nr:hypothetical protein CKAH01_15298 [Colletotrichum kahawae]
MPLLKLPATGRVQLGPASFASKIPPSNEPTNTPGGPASQPHNIIVILIIASACLLHTPHLAPTSDHFLLQAFHLSPPGSSLKLEPCDNGA